jgi:hypothetical protein
MTDYDEVLDECQRLADYWMNEQNNYDVEIAPSRDEYRLTLTPTGLGVEVTDWYDSLDSIDTQLVHYFGK